MARQPFNTRWAQGVEDESSLNSFQAPNNARLLSGWEGGQDKDAPPAGQENWWHNRADSALQGLERNGVMNWHMQAVYGLGAPSYAGDGNYYESLVAENVGNDPVSSPGFWRYSGSSFFAGHEPGDSKMVWHNGVPPAGWLKCNGALLSRASYQRLFAAIGTAHNIGGETSLQFRLPDTRGEFIRGFDDGKGVDPGRAFGSGQLDEFESHNHRVLIKRNAALTTPGTGGAMVDGTEDHTFVDSHVTPQPGQAGGSETRPRNKTATYWIKY